MPEPNQYYLNVLFLEHEGQGWVARCLQYDIAAQGSTLKDTKDAFERTVIGQMALDLSKNREPFEGFHQAPSCYWQEFKEAERLVHARMIVQVRDGEVQSHDAGCPASPFPLGVVTALTYPWATVAIASSSVNG